MPVLATYLGLFAVTLTTLMYQILLTRVFSVSLYYHFAFMAVSIAMFGLTAGAILVYLRPNAYTKENVHQRLTSNSLWFALSLVATFLIHLYIPTYSEISWRGFFSMGLMYVIVSIPFVFSGVVVCLALTKFEQGVGKLYAADLAGAALGCLGLIVLLGPMDAPSLAILCGGLAALSAALFAFAPGARKYRIPSGAVAAVLILFSCFHAYKASQQEPIIRFFWAKGAKEIVPVYEKWNWFARINVIMPLAPFPPNFWAPSSTWQSDQVLWQNLLFIDANAKTVITKYEGDPEQLEFLKYDVTNIAHFLRDNMDVLVVGMGGGRDILASFAFDQKSVTAVEINHDIIRAVTEVYRDFTNVADDPRVTIVNDEARSFIARHDEPWDMIQISLIDTWASTAAGAFALTENSLYTVEAWELFLDRLTPNGIFTCSRWYFRELPGEMYRMVALAAEAYERRGIENPRRHILIVRNMNSPVAAEGVGTIMISPEPFSDEDVARLVAVCEEKGYELVLTPDYAIDETFAFLAEGQDLDDFYRNFPIDISPSTDDNPFFFQMLRLKDIFQTNLWEQGPMTFNMNAVFILGVLLITVVILTIICVILPLFLRSEKGVLKGAGPLMFYFAAIGFGFILVEISQLQRLVVFLGHPVYSLSVVLFTVLLTSAAGSFFSEIVMKKNPYPGRTMIALLLGVIILFGLLTPVLVANFPGATTFVRVSLAVLTLAPLGFFMGMCFPMGMRLAQGAAPGLTPWLWGINGATSVCGSVLAVVIALGSSISTAFWCGAACYVVALVSYTVQLAKKKG